MPYKKDLQSRRKMEINDVIMKTGQWEMTKYSLGFGKVYANQREFRRKILPQFATKIKKF